MLACFRLVAILGWTLPCALLQSLLLILPGRAKAVLPRLYWSGVRCILGVRLTLIGTVSNARPVVFVANHSSWLDIVVLGGVLPGRFIAKGEIAGWPMVNLIARLGRSVFVSRSKSGVGRERETIMNVLDRGDNLILFPEGTTSDGVRTLRFQTSFLAVTHAKAMRTVPYVQPVTLVYDQVEGLPVRRQDRPLLSWYGAMDMVSHFPRVARLRSLHATLVLDRPFRADLYPDRKSLSGMLERRLAANAAALRQGRGVAPLDLDRAARERLLG